MRTVHGSDPPNFLCQVRSLHSVILPYFSLSLVLLVYFPSTTFLPRDRPSNARLFSPRGELLVWIKTRLELPLVILRFKQQPNDSGLD